jgi:predicted AAA+ superfamily ATPase
MKYIRRAIENHLLKMFGQYKAVLVTGARQVGKSTMLKAMFSELSYVSLDDPWLEEQAREQSSMFMMMHPAPVIFDEIQRVPELFRMIKIACDQSESYGLYCLSGSQAFHLMKGISESLSGRVAVLELSGLSMREIYGDDFDKPFIPTMHYLLDRKKTNVDAQRMRSLWQIIHRGSYPELQDSVKDWNGFYSNYLKTYLERDLRELSAVQDLDVFRRFMVSVAARTGEILNYSNIADEIGRDVKTIKNWISLLETSGIIYLLEPYSANILKRAIKSPKLYMRDTGLTCYLTRWLTPETLENGAFRGHIFETFVISEILKSYVNCGIDYRYHVSYYRGRDKQTDKATGIKSESEIDLIIEENGTLYPIEIKASSHVTASETSAFMVLDKIPNKQRGMGAVVCMCPEPGMLRDNVLQIPVWYI